MTEREPGRTDALSMSELPVPPEESRANVVPEVSGDEAAIVITADMLAAPANRQRRDFEQGMSFVPLVACSLIAVNIAAFAWEAAVGALQNEQAILAAGAVNWPELQRGEYWRLATSMFLHADASHLVGNCVALYILGMAAEHGFGSGKTLVGYLAIGVAASLLSVWLQPVPTVGASGAIFGLMGAVMIFMHRHRREFYVRDARIGVVLLVWSLYQIATGFLNPQIANWAHVGGLAGGAFLGLCLKPRPQIGA